MAQRAARRRRHWLVKTDPESYSIADLARDGTTSWTGVRNFQARNTLRDEMSVGDPVLFYHSSAEPTAITGLAEVASVAYPDESAFDKSDDHYDSKSKRDTPTWFAVDLRHVKTWREPITREQLAAEPALRKMALLRRGSRLSVQPVTVEEFAAVLRLAR
jgi:predicted RNA-binding protein with PUA-like domain